MGKIILFDLYDTLLRGIFFSFDSGLEYLYDHVFCSACTKQMFDHYAKQMKPLYDQRAATNKEIFFIRQDYPFLCEKCHVKPVQDTPELEYQVMNSMQRSVLPDAVLAALKRLQDKHTKMYILTNSIFSANAQKRLLREFKIDGYFCDLFCSADFGYRKPDKRFFDYAVTNILKENPDCTKKDIVFIGNDYRSDMHGAVLAGLQAIWYNINHEENVDRLPIRQFADWDQIG